MLILIEGIQGAGKTTLANGLSLRTRAQVVHGDRPTRHPLLHYTLPLAGYRPWLGQPSIICDRWHLSEIVYGAKRGETEMTTAGFVAIDEFLHRLGAVLIYKRATPLHARQACINRDGVQAAPQLSELFDDRDAFNEVILESRLPTLMDPTLSEIIEFASKRQAEVRSG